MKTKNIFLGLTVAAISACTGSQDSYYETLAELSKELQETNDTILGYSIENGYAIWVHTDAPESGDGDTYEPAVKSIHYCDLKTKGKKVLLSTKDEQNIFPANVDFGNYIEGLSSLNFSLDSCALILESGMGEYYILSLSKPDTLFWITVDENNNPLTKNVYTISMTGELPTLPDGSVGQYEYELSYNTQGERTYEADMMRVWYEFEELPNRLPISLLKDENTLVNEVIKQKAYKIETVYNFAANGVTFKQDFGPNGKNHYFELYVQNVKEETNWDNPSVKRYKVDGENFSIYTTDSNFSSLKYPCWVIILAAVNDARAIQDNAMASLFADMLGADTSKDFTFTKAQLILSSSK